VVLSHPLPLALIVLLGANSSVFYITSVMQKSVVHAYHALHFSPHVLMPEN